ncbi:hypothetical protein BS17DRAFT_781150 [Gyrodon lividus]|nr:hypothetical protein BS17DRAFT_781150 [Gyrodon lividus]
MQDSRSIASRHASCCPLSVRRRTEFAKALGCYADLHMPTAEFRGPRQTRPDARLSPTISFGM